MINFWQFWVLIIFLSNFINIDAQTYNPIFIIKSEILRLDNPDVIREIGSLKISTNYGTLDEFHIVDEYNSKFKENRDLIITNEHSTFLFNKSNLLIYHRNGEKTTVYNKTGKDSIIVIKKPYGEDYYKLFYYNKNDSLRKIVETVDLKQKQYTFVKYETHVSSPEKNILIEEKKVVEKSEDFPEKFKHFLNEIKTTKVFSGNGSYKATRELNGEKDSWYQEKKYNLQGLLTWEDEYWHSSLEFEYDQKKRLIKKTESQPYFRNDKQIYSYYYDEYGNINKFQVEYFNYGTELFATLVVNINYKYMDKKTIWKEAIADFMLYEINELTKNIKDKTTYKINKL